MPDVDSYQLAIVIVLGYSNVKARCLWEQVLSVDVLNLFLVVLDQDLYLVACELVFLYLTRGGVPDRNAHLLVVQNLVSCELHPVVLDQQHTILFVLLYHVLLNRNHTRDRQNAILVASNLVVCDQELLTIY